VILVVAVAASASAQSLTYIRSLQAELRSPSRSAVAADGTILVTDTFYDHVARFDAGGNLLGTWPVPEGPVGIAVHPDGRYFVALRQPAKVAIYDSSFTRVGYLGEGLVTFVRPTDIDVATNTGNIYVADPGADRVYGFNSAGALVLTLGTRGSGNGQFRSPSAVTVDETLNRLIVADHDNFRVQVFTTAGAFVRKFGDRNKYPKNQPAEGWTPRTQGLTVDAQSRIYVADALMSHVRLFNSAGTELVKLLQYGSSPGQLRTPCDLALSPDGSKAYVVNTSAAAVEVYQVSSRMGADGPRAPEASPGGSSWCEYDFLSSLWGGGGYRTVYEGPHFIESPITCGRCHAIRSQPGGHEGLPEGQAVLCMSCHTAGGQGLDLPIHALDLADPYGTNPAAVDGQGRSHAWNVPAVSASADSVGPTAGGEMARYLTGGVMKCATCHSGHNNTAGAPYLRVSNTRDAMCKECHAPRNEGLGQRGTHPVGFTYPGGTGEFPPAGDLTPLFIKDGRVECMTCHAPHYADSGGANAGEGDGMLLRTTNDDTLCRTCHAGHVGHTPGGSWQPSCKDCHDPHDPNSQNLSLVARTVRNQTLGQDKPVVFTARSGPNSFDDGDPAVNDGICQVCHTATAYHQHDGSGAAHNDGTTCTDCHPHNAGFMATGGSCTDCHANPQDNGDNVPPGGRRAVVGEFPASNAHAHYGTQLGGDACLVCHAQTTHMDGYVDLIDPDSGSIYRFVRPGDLTSDPDLSDFCTHCHDANGAARLPNPQDPFGNGNPPPDVASKFQGTLQWNEWYGDTCMGEEGTLRAVNSHHDISSADQTLSGAKLECLNCHGAHTAAASQKTVDPFNATSPWSGTGNAFCLACHSGGNGPTDPGFPPNVFGPTVPLRGLDTCDYTAQPWYVDYTWTHSAHGLDSKRAWPGYSGAPGADVNCADCHDPHGSWTPTNPTGNPYMIRDFVDGTMYVDDGNPAHGWTGPPWNTFGTARPVTIAINGVTVGWGTPAGLCSACHADWLEAMHFHEICTGCQTCHGHGQAWGEYDWEGGDHDTPCPTRANSSRPPAHDRNVFPTLQVPVPTEGRRTETD
jgi:DNA-binding beta-propeller fold protein YncE